MKAPAVVRLGARFAALAFAGVIALVIAAQFVHIAHRNIAYALELRDVQRDIVGLQQRRDQQQRDIARLSDPRGAIPEIHDRLHLVGDHEEIIYLKRPDPVPAPE